MPLEIEVKFALEHLSTARVRVLNGGGRLLADRMLERTEQFDRPDRSLSSAGIVLRLREAQEVQITYKEPSRDPLVRREISAQILDASHGRELLSALGFEPAQRYEKYREIFALHGCQVMLDELPFGCFVEIEGPSRETIEELAAALGLDWEARVKRSYVELFRDLKSVWPACPDEATFRAFGRVSRPALDILNLRPALRSEASPAPE